MNDEGWIKNNFSVGYAEDFKNGCNSHGEAIILNPSRRDTTIIHYSFKFRFIEQFINHHKPLGSPSGRAQTVEKVHFMLGFFVFLWYNIYG